MIPAVAVMLLVAILPQTSVAVRVAFGRGQPGIFTADREICSHDRNGAHCRWRGQFDGSDGVLLRSVYLEGDPHGWHAGTTAKVIWLSDEPGSVFRSGDPRPLLLVLGLSAVAAVALVAWAVAARCRVLRRPTPRWIKRVNGYCGWPPTT